MFKTALSEIVCPLCHSQANKLVVGLESSGLLCEIQGCLDCTNAWTSPAPGFVEYDREDFHAQSIASDSKETTKTIADLPCEWQRSINMQVSLIKRHMKPKAKILEIGCGEGILLSELANSGFTVKGIEPSLAASSRAISKGLDVTASLFPDYTPDDQFDLIILSHVLEHIEKPYSFLKEIVQLIPQSYLLLIQTNYRGLIPKIYPKAWYGWAPHQHYWHFTPSGIAYVATKMKLSLMECEYSSLVHVGKKSRLLQIAAATTPRLFDQFHALFKST